jgi:UDP:flavonoid glycosyltransferase YjiC (YdhE family)
LGGMLAALEGLPLVQIVRTATHPTAPCLMWWEEPPKDLVSPDPKPVFNPILKGLGLPPIEKGEDLLQGDLYLLPSIPDLDPLPEAEATFYTGPLARFIDQNDELTEWMSRFDSQKPLVYVTIGGGAGPVGGPRFYQMLFEAFGSEDVNVVASTGRRISPEDLPEPPANFRLESWVPGQAVIAKADLVVYPGGYGTTMEIVRAGKPGLVIPFHTEQESNGRRLEQQSAGKVLLPASGEGERLEKPWYGGSFSYRVFTESSLSPSELRRTVKEMLEDPRYRQGAERLKAAASYYSGAPLAADLVENLVNSGERIYQKVWDGLTWKQKISLSIPSI